MVRTILAAALLVAPALLLAGCGVERADTPEKAFDLLMTHVRNREYEKVWEMYSQRLREKNLKEYADFKARMQELIDSNDQNLDAYDKFVVRQVGVGIREMVRLPEYEIVMRSLEAQREVILKFRIVAEPRVRGDLALVEVSAGDDLPAATWRFVRRGPRWLLDDTPIKESTRQPSASRKPR